MTFNIGTVQGGTHAGWRSVKQRPKAWTCPSCGAKLKYYWLACPTDKHPRPEE